jgi:hypothetical protein
LSPPFCKLRIHLFEFFFKHIRKNIFADMQKNVPGSAIIKIKEPAHGRGDSFRRRRAFALEKGLGRDSS